MSTNEPSEALIVAEKQTSEIAERIKPQVSEVVQTAQKLVAALKELGTPEARLVVEQHGQDALRREKAIKAEFEPGVKAAKALYDFWKEKLDNAIEPLATAKKIDAAGLSEYDVQQERARKLAEEIRQAIVRKAQADHAALVKAQQEAALKSEEDSRLAHASEAEKLGNDAAPLILDTPTAAVPLPPMTAPLSFIPSPEPEKTGGSVGKDLFKYKTESLIDLVKYVAVNGDLSLLFTEKEIADFRSSGVKQYVERTKVEGYPLPGVRAWLERSTSFSTR